MILLLLLFNGVLLYFVLEIIAGFFVDHAQNFKVHGVHSAQAIIGHVQNAGQSAIQHVHHIQNFHQFFNAYHEYINVILAILIICGISWLFYSGVGQWFLRLICGGRKAIEREEKKIYPVIEKVQQEVEKVLGIKPIKHLHLMIIDDPMPNAAAIGKNTIMIARSLYEMSNEEELAGVIAHEMAHLHNGDSIRLGIALGVSTITLVVSAVAVLLSSLVSIASKIFSKGGQDVGLLATIAGFVCTLFLWLFLIFIKSSDWVIALAMLFQGRKQEYRADEFAVKAGFGVGLLSFMEKLKDLHMEGKRSIIDRLCATHPPAMLRIGKLEEVLVIVR